MKRKRRIHALAPDALAASRETRQIRGKLPESVVNGFDLPERVFVSARVSDVMLGSLRDGHPPRKLVGDDGILLVRFNGTM
jgi:hypothetical protein